MSHKSHKIQQVIDEHDRNLNLHEIKAKTGAGSGHKHHTTDIEVADELNNSQPIHKSHKIQDVIDEHDGHLNLHQIKTKTGLMSIFWTQKVKLFYAALLANNSH